MVRRFATLLFAAVLVAASVAPAAIAKNGNGKNGAGGRPETVASAADQAKSKLHPKLLRQLESGSTKNVLVFAVVNGGHKQAAKYLKDVHVADAGKVAILVGKIRTQALPKLAGARNVVSVGPIDFAKTGRPLGVPDPDLDTRPSTAVLNKILKGLYKKEIPYSKAPPLAESNFEELKELALLDARTHNFVEAWEAGYTGDGVTVGVLDGGTDFGHPDLIGTWQVWEDAPYSGWNGWPKAFDPFGALQWIASSHVQQGLSWYVETQAKTCPDWADKGPKATCMVKFATRTGPSRNFGAPAGFKQHTYRFPAGVSKSGNVFLGSHPDDHLLLVFGERPAFLVTDSTTAGVYDTVYVDLDNDYRFDDEKPVNKSSPVSYRDMDGDGYTDLSGGLLYYISDGVTPVAGGVDAFLDPETDDFTLGYGPGELVAWTGDFDPAIGGHGTLTASNIVGQGVINGKAPTFDDVPGGTYPGAVIGGAPDARLAPFGDIYFSFEFSTQLGYLLSTTSGVDITSNSYGSSNVDNDGWDAASQEADWIHFLTGGFTTPLFSTGNGAPGYGTTAPPAPYAGIAVGASTQFGGTGWDSIANASQIVDNDVMVWSNRGFGANGTAGVDIVADGAFSAGDITLNAVLNGQTAWETWGGTSRSTPVAAGAAALVYEAWRDAHGPVPFDFNLTVKDILKSSAMDLGYNSTVQGAGSLDAGRAVQAALGDAAVVTPSEWRVGDYRGTEHEVFANIIAPGGSDSQEFTIDGAGSWEISDRQLVRTDHETFNFSSENLGQESPANFNAPDYLVDLSDDVRDHPNADLMVIRVNFPRDQFDAHPEDYDEDQAWRLLTYNWTDVNDDGDLWTDSNGNGVVNYSQLGTSHSIDGFLDIDYGASEIDEGEYVRFMYHRAGSNALMSFVRDPADRMADGLFLGLQHSARNAAIPVTDFEVEISWYENVDWDWVTTPDSATGSFEADIEVPADAPYGMYEGAIVLEQGDDSIVVPVVVAVAATVELDEGGHIDGALQFGGSDVADDQAVLPYNNGSVFGANDWTWRAESGDWRFFFLDVPETPAEGSLFLAQTTWDGTAPFTDLDTLIMGPSENACQLFDPCFPSFGGDYILDTLGGSPNTNIGGGVWTFNTATGGAVDFITAPMQEGLHNLVIHQVSWEGDDFTTPFEVNIGGAAVSPSAVVETTTEDSGGFDVTVTASVDLPGLTAEGFGLSQPLVEDVQGQQDNPNDPSSASIKRDVTIDHASRLTVATTLASDDFDLFVVYDANGDGTFASNEIVGSSATGTSNEFVELVAPPDGDYQVWVQGWSVAGTPTLELLIDAVQGNDLSVGDLPAGDIPAGTPVVVHVDFTKAMTVGESYFGELQLGPPTAPTALTVPITITKN